MFGRNSIGNGHRFFSSPKIKLEGETRQGQVRANMEKLGPCMGHRAEARFPSLCPKPSEFLEQRRDNRKLGDPPHSRAGFCGQRPCPNSRCCLQAQIKPLTVTHWAFCGDNRESKSRGRGPETAWKFPHTPMELRHRTKYLPRPKWNSREIQIWRSIWQGIRRTWQWLVWNTGTAGGHSSQPMPAWADVCPPRMLTYQVPLGLQILQVMIRLDSYPPQVPHKSSTTRESMFNSLFQKILTGPNQIPYRVGTNAFFFPFLGS